MGFFKNIKYAWSLLSREADASDVGQQFAKTGLGSLINKLTGKGLTGAEMQANEFTANQAQINRDWEERMSNTAFQRQVADMQSAGVNPALLYGSGASGASTPSGSSASSVTPNSGTNLGELMQLFLLKKQGNLLDAQARNTDADTDKKKGETEQLSLINKYYPHVTETSLDKTLSEIGVNNERIKEIRSNVDVNQLTLALGESEKVIKKAEADEAGSYFKARRAFEEAQGDKAKAEKAEIAVRTAMEELERSFMAHTNTKMGSATIVAIASALGTLLSNFKLDVGDSPTPGWIGASENFKSWLKKFGAKFGSWYDGQNTSGRE